MSKKRTPITKHFFKEEFACPCCGRYVMSPFFISLLEIIRIDYKKPMVIPEGGGYRCPKYQHEKHGDDLSAHTLGRAADIACYNSVDRHRLDELRMENGITRIGIYDKHIHIDIAGPEIDEKFIPIALWTGKSK